MGAVVWPDVAMLPVITHNHPGALFLCTFNTDAVKFNDMDALPPFYTYVYSVFTHSFEMKRKTTSTTSEVGRAVFLSRTSCPEPSHISPSLIRQGTTAGLSVRL